MCVFVLFMCICVRVCMCVRSVFYCFLFYLEVGFFSEFGVYLRIVDVGYCVLKVICFFCIIF